MSIPNSDFHHGLLVKRSRSWTRRRRPDVIKVVLEGASADTRTNMREILSHPRIFGSGELHTVAFVSSTFHLPRMAEEFSVAVQGASAKLPDLESVLFVPAETKFGTGVVTESEYITATFLELYRRIVAQATGVLASTQGRRVNI